ncbi:FIST C-terminal domain-containing protein [Ferruginibacter lapsinanis]|uniref:FIST signal transduction protein n=1 Tax=Ferruginibacter lapsinanis TaxID=563172 RepID=UPI001E2B9AB1|nr:FIST N-terminal domain-containing protein [Ferruginibacter lapsinanis]UEG48668.1 FIST C-terminal domain-containing protein [Ferruginibacter lapsinanis]
MRTSLYQLAENTWNEHPANNANNKNKAQLVLSFGGKEQLKDKNIYAALKEQFPVAQISMCSTAGEIYHDAVLDNAIIAIALEFEKTAIHTASINISNCACSYDAAIKLADKLPKKDLTYVMIFADGSLVNGSELVKGLNTTLDKDVLITGGIAGDAANFQSTLVGLNEQPKEGEVIAIGFYGDNLLVTHGSRGGWEMFGVEKEITKSADNVLYEIDDSNALELYKKYLGSEAENLPGAALLFPLAITVPGSSTPVVRTILSIDESNNSMTFAGDIPQGASVRFMKSNLAKLTEAAAAAAKQTMLKEYQEPAFTMLVSCVGRKIILGPRIEEEVEAVNETFNNKTLLAGFYSYGEIAPFDEGGYSQLHNQTMTITSFYELP